MELVLKNKKYKIINSIDIQKSSRELKYTDITIDFTNATFEDLPLYFQEGKVIDENGNVIFLGYIESYKLPTLNISSKIHNEITITFMTPRKLAAKKTITIFRTDSIKNIIDQILQPLYVDGYKLKECILEDKAITVQFISKTVEEAIGGAKDIIAEEISDDTEFRKQIKKMYYREGFIVTKNAKEENPTYSMYNDFKEKISTIPSHRILAINRGEKEEFLKVKIEKPEEKILQYIEKNIPAHEMQFGYEKINDNELCQIDERGE